VIAQPEFVVDGLLDPVDEGPGWYSRGGVVGDFHQSDAPEARTAARCEVKPIPGHLQRLPRLNGSSVLGDPIIPNPSGSPFHSVRFLVRFPDMESTAASVRSTLDSLSDRAFVHARRVPGPTGAVEAELSRLVYWVSPLPRRKTLPLPSPVSVPGRLASKRRDGLASPPRSLVDHRSLCPVECPRRLQACGSVPVPHAVEKSISPRSRSQ
jgi:hypothetical protein